MSAAIVELRPGIRRAVSAGDRVCCADGSTAVVREMTCRLSGLFAVVLVVSGPLAGALRMLPVADLAAPD
jgi:hypothetical protein